MNKKDIVRRIDDMLFYEESLPKEEKELLINIFSEMSLTKQNEFNFKSKTTLISEYEETIENWNTYLQIFEDKQEFETCAKILKIIDIEEREFRKVFFKYKINSDAQANYYNQVISNIKTIKNKK